MAAYQQPEQEATGAYFKYRGTLAGFSRALAWKELVMKSSEIPYIASPARRNFPIINSLLVLLLVSATFGGENPQFEVASIRASFPGASSELRYARCYGGPGTKDPGHWTCTNMSLSNLLIKIFDLKGFQMAAVASVPSGDRFTIAAKIPEGTTKEQFKQMLVNLLIERFGLKFHREKKEMQGYELVVAKNGPKLKESGPDSSKGRDAGYNNRIVFFGLAAEALSNGVWDQITMEDFAAMLSSPGLAGLMPVIDRTGLKGIYDISLKWAPDVGNVVLITAAGGIPIASVPSGAPSIFGALKEQLGLQLEKKKVMVEIIVIDHIDESPTEN